jgi:hypothetical protein
MNFYKT